MWKQRDADRRRTWILWEDLRRLYRFACRGRCKPAFQLPDFLQLPALGRIDKVIGKAAIKVAPERGHEDTVAKALAHEIEIAHCDALTTRRGRKGKLERVEGLPAMGGDLEVVFRFQPQLPSLQGMA